MAQIISATTKFIDRSNRAGRSGKYQCFLRKAESLLDLARAAAAEDRLTDAVELAYQAGLRGAGAWVAATPVGKRKRLPTSAWEQVELISADAKEWAMEFRRYSRLRSRLVTGLDDAVKPAVAFELIELSARFIATVRGEGDVELNAA